MLGIIDDVHKMAISQIKAGAILNYISLGIYNLVGLLYTPYMLAMMGKSEYGLYSIVASVIAYLTLMDLGLSDAVIRYSVKYKKEGQSDKLYELYGMFTYIYIIIGTIVALIGLILAFNVDYLFGATMSIEELSRAKIMLFLMACNLALSFYFCIYGSIIVANEKFIFQKALQILRIILNTGVMIILLHYGYKAIAMIVTQTIINILIIILNISYCQRTLHIKITLKKIDWRKLKEILTFSFWVFFFIIIERVYWSSGQFILGTTIGTAAVAVFSVAITLEHMYMGMSNSISSVLLPRITAISSGKDSDSALSDIFINIGRIQYFILSFIFCGFVVLGRLFLNIWAGATYSETYFITIILFIAHTIPLVQSTGISILKARNQMQKCSIIYACCAILCLIGEFYLSKRIGATGCAIAIALSMLIGQVLILNIYYSREQKIDIKAFWINILKMSLIPIICTIGGLMVISNVHMYNIGHLLLGGSIFSIIFLSLAWKYSLNNTERELIISLLKKNHK